MTGADYIKHYWGAALSMLGVAAWFSPWYAADVHAALGFYILAFLWFLLGAWLPLAICIAMAIRRRKRNDAAWKHPAIAAGITALCCATVWAGLLNGYMVTV